MYLPDQMPGFGLKNMITVYSGLIPILKLCIDLALPLLTQACASVCILFQGTANTKSVSCNVAGIILKMIFF